MHSDRSLYHILTSLAMAALWLCLPSCGISDHDITTDAGLISVGYTIEGTYVSPDGQTRVVPTEATADFDLTISDLAGQYSGKWVSADSMPVRTLLRTGTYTASLLVGDPNDYTTPTYSAAQEFTVGDNSQTNVALVARLTESVVEVDIDQSLFQTYPNAFATIHCVGYQYYKALPDQAPMYIEPGVHKLFLSLNETVTLMVPLSATCEAARGYLWQVALDGEALTITAPDGNEAVISLTKELLEASAPHIDAQGFVPGQPLQVIEGEDPPGDVGFNVACAGALQALTLSFTPDQNGQEMQQYIPRESNLLNAAERPSDIEVRQTATGYQVRVDALLAAVRTQQQLSYSLSLVAVDALGRASNVQTLAVLAQPVNLSIRAISPAILGTDYVEVAMVASYPLNIDGLSVQYQHNGQWTTAEKLTISTSADNPKEYTLGFDVPTGRDNMPIRITYFGQSTVTGTIYRQAPEYKITIEPLSGSALLIVSSDAGAKAEAEIVSLLTPYIDGQEATVIGRYPDEQTIVITGLKAETQYTLTTTALEGNATAAMTPPQKFVTETARPVPEGDFEDVREAYTYSRLPQGGKYSLTTTPIYNYQNFADFLVKLPSTSWATVDEKTFNAKTRNRNTWYMQPSAMVVTDEVQNGHKAMLIQSVGWDLNGEAIPDYLQAANATTPLHYNANAPTVAHRSAGRLFLGSYEFDPATQTEVYTPGVPFASRPLVFNGYYKYTTDANNPDDRAVVMISLETADGTEIARGVEYLDPAPGYRSFSVDFNYVTMRQRPATLYIMFCSSAAFGDIADEDANVSVTADLPNSRYIGSRLWIDNLYFTY